MDDEKLDDQPRSMAAEDAKAIVKILSRHKTMRFLIVTVGIIVGLWIAASDSPSAMMSKSRSLSSHHLDVLRTLALRSLMTQHSLRSGRTDTNTPLRASSGRQLYTRPWDLSWKRSALRIRPSTKDIRFLFLEQCPTCGVAPIHDVFRRHDLLSDGDTPTEQSRSENRTSPHRVEARHTGLCAAGMKRA